MKRTHGNQDTDSASAMDEPAGLTSLPRSDLSTVVRSTSRFPVAVPVITPGTGPTR